MADNKYQNTSNITTNTTGKSGLVTDLNPSYVGNDIYSYARNLVRASKDGDLGSVSNESSTLECVSAPYKVIGQIKLPEDQVMVFSTDNITSEIGVADLKSCEYEKLLSLPCLNFNQDFMIHGVAKNDFQRGTVVTFTDKYNPVRRLELKKASTITNCDDILLFKKIQHPCITVKKGQVGNMPDGTYSVAIAYVIDDQIFSDWYSITNRVVLSSKNGSNSIDVTIDDLDSEFDKYALVVVGNYIEPDTKSVTKAAKIIGTFNTNIKTVSVTDFLNSNYVDVKLSDLTVHKKSWLKAGIVTANSSYLLLGDLVMREEENYQLRAMSIKMKYVVEQVLASYYETDGRDVGYYRDENYEFFIQGIYTSGELTPKYHIPGPEPDSFYTSSATGNDVYEFDNQFSDCDRPDKVPRWMAENTASLMVPKNAEFVCDRRILGEGDMGYFESTITYPNNVAMFGEWAGTPQRFPKMPDESKVPRYNTINGKKYINIIGVRFYDIPAFDSPDIVGYKITRSDRKYGNGTVIARGIATNMRSYHDDLLDKEVFYANYPINDLNPDVYLSSTQTVYKNKKESNFNPLTDYHLDKFSFYSPHTSFEPRYSVGSELKFEAEEIATINGKFDLVFKHPRQKLMNQFAFWVSAAVGFIETALIALGKKKSQVDIKSGESIGVPSAKYGDVTVRDDYSITSVEDLIAFDIPGYIAAVVASSANPSSAAANAAKAQKIITVVQAGLLVLASLAVKIPYSILGGIKAADDIFNIISNFTGYTDYAYQYNGHALFERSIPMKAGNKRRRLKITDNLYIPSSKVTVNGNEINNKGRERFVYLETNKPVSAPSVEDTSRGTIGSFGLCSDPFANVTSTGSAYYVTSKVPNPNQYGVIGSAPSVSMHSCPIPVGDETPVLYGGDCVIEKMTMQKRMAFFNQSLANSDFPQGTEYDYRKYHNMAYARYWADFTKYDFSELLSGATVNFAKFTRTTTAKHNLDCKSGDKGSIARVDDAYFYLFNNMVMEFYVEADYNVGLREDTKYPHYGRNNQNLTEIFRADNLEHPEEFEISQAYRDIYTTEIFAEQQRLDFDPSDPIPPIQPNSVIYSLPSFNLQDVDNWQYFLPLNIFNFRESDHGKLTAMHKIDQDRLIFLFSKSSPYVSMGRDFLELEESGRKITIGDGGLFAQDPREVMPTDNNYGASTSRYAFSNTHLGRFYPSNNQGRIISFTDSLDDITRQGMSYWCKNYMPILLYEYFPEYDKDENPASGVGYLTAFDSFNETIYVTKRDFTPKREYAADIQYSGGTFNFKGTPILLRSKYFNDVSWTLSYSPIDKSFVSWHDWHPDLVIQTDNHFCSVKDKTIWKHNERFDSFCNFYGTDFPFMLEILSSSGQTIETLRSMEYLLEVYHYKNNGRDRFHVHHENFDKMWVWNTEQMSPLLNLIYRNRDPEIDIEFPKRNPIDSVTWDVLYSKEENKYRVNQFWDSVKDRGEFTPSEFHLVVTDESGYKQIQNPLALDILKPEEQRKKFRHYFNKVRLIKTVSGPNKFICKIHNVKKQVSIR